MYTHVYGAISWNLATLQCIYNALFEKIAVRLTYFTMSSPPPHLPVPEIAPFEFHHFVLMPISKV